jgi:predicted phage-related endonuclease
MVGKLTSDAILSGSMAPVLMNEAHPTYGMSRNDLMARIMNAKGIGYYDTPQSSAGEAADWGNDLEAMIIKKSVERLGFDSFNDEVTEVYKYDDLFAVSLDGIIKNGKKTISASDGVILMNGQETMTLEGDGIIESKLTSVPYTEVPPPYRGPWQLQMQMMCYGASWGIIATLYQGTRLVLYVYQADQEKQKQLVDAAKDFYQRLEGPDWYPAMDGADAARTWGKGEDDLDPVSLAPIADLAMQYYDAKRAAKAAEALAKELEPRIMDHMAVHEAAYLDDELGNTMFEIKWPTRSFKAQPEKTTPAKPARVERQKSLTIAAKWMGE